jgi:3-hydroxyisobutyrate dehydrogenase-like beta-hydroxyacid dehydrogenase
MLSDDAAVLRAGFGGAGIIENLGGDSLHISSSTISVAMSGQLAAAHADSRQRFIAAPILGRPDMAAIGLLFVFAAGEAGAIDAAKPLLDAIGQRTFVVSHEPQVANAVKLSCNFLIASVIESLGEAMAFIARNGVDRHDYLAMLTSTLFGAPIYTTYGKQIAGGTFSPHGFAAPLGLRTYGSCFRQRMICMRMPVTAGMSIPLAVPARSVCVRRGKSDQPGSRDSLQLILRQ